jgi:hypothetical protein
MRQKVAETPAESATPRRRGHPVYTANPSIVGNFPVTTRTKVQKGGRQALMVTPDTGEVLGSGTFGFITDEVVDNERFVKIYLDGVKQHGQLSKAGLLIFECVYTQISGPQGKDRDEVKLNHAIAQAWKPDISRATYYRGIGELLDRGFLFRSMAADVYYVNVRFMFNGDRLAVVRAYRRRKGTDDPHGLDRPSSKAPAAKATLHDEGT